MSYISNLSSRLADKRVKFLASRYPDAETKSVPLDKPTEVVSPEAKPQPSGTTDTAKQSGSRALAIGLLVSGGTVLAASLGMGAGAIGLWSEASSPDTYFDRWQSINATGRSLSIASGVFGAVGVGLLVPGVVLFRASR